MRDDVVVAAIAGRRWRALQQAAGLQRTRVGRDGAFRDVERTGDLFEAPRRILKHEEPD